MEQGQINQLEKLYVNSQNEILNIKVILELLIDVYEAYYPENTVYFIAHKITKNIYNSNQKFLKTKKPPIRYFNRFYSKIQDIKAMIKIINELHDDFKINQTTKIILKSLKAISTNYSEAMDLLYSLTR